MAPQGPQEMARAMGLMLPRRWFMGYRKGAMVMANETR